MAERFAASTLVISDRRAMAQRLKRNYIWMFCFWRLPGVEDFDGHVASDRRSRRAGGVPRSWYAGADIGPLPGMLIIAAVVVFYGWLLYTAFWVYRDLAEADDGMVHV